MKKLYFLSLFVLGGLVATAQNFAVTFQVDMSNETVNANGVHVAGNFQMADGNASDWDPAGTMLTDSNSDGVYVYTAMLPAGSYEYKFVNGNAWGGDEGVPSSCAVNGNRAVTVAGAMTIGVECFGLCGPCPTATDTADVTFIVDMTGQTVDPNGVHIAGGFGPGGYAAWDPAAIALSNTTGNQYAVTLRLPQGPYPFKFVNGNAWGSDESSIPAECNVGGNREITIDGDNDNESELLTDTVQFIAAFNMCPPTDSIDVTVKLDMAGQILCSGLVHMPGDFGGAGLPAWDPAGIALTDGDQDGVYTVTVRLPEGSYAHKFVNGSDWGGVEAVPNACLVNGNRDLTVAGNGDAFSDIIPMDYEICFASCASSCPTVVAPADVTFRVDMNDEIVAAEGVFVAGTLPCAGWVKDSFEMLDADADGIYEFTWTELPAGIYSFKFYNGDCGDDGCNETADFETAGCGSDNGVGGWNREIDLTSLSGDTTLPAWKYNSCEQSTVSVPTLKLSELRIYPNPASSDVKIEFANDVNEEFTASLVDLNGRTLISNSSNTTTIHLNVDGLTSGVYMIKLTNASGAFTTNRLLIN